MPVVAKLMILVTVALLATVGLLVAEWRTHQLSRGASGAKAAVAVLLIGVLISLLIVR
ncbi:hypothetical protein [Lacticaseibacillus nasuensis]|uniref:hypothetical protein n=1 Tax=Lacticaseibacillus nasuensis TaxID=944671 RepID=UPI0022458A80|nr:hypothetical protein [Lacticaseibacillus nasuensis]MCX2455806.1 hypothetical protein [Lacticaseibacillus nasuensis]